MDKSVYEGQLAVAYQEQVVRDEESAEIHGPLMGYKIALNAKPAQRALGLDVPVLAPMRMNSIVPSGATLDKAWDEPLLEIELGLRLLNFDRPYLVSAVPAFEVVAGPVSSDGLEFVRSSAAFGSAILGSSPIPLPNSALERLEAQIYGDGELLHRASFNSDLGSPLDVLAWLSETLDSQSRPLMAGMIALSGAAGNAISMKAGVEYRGAIFDEDELVGEVLTRWLPRGAGVGFND